MDRINARTAQSTAPLARIAIPAIPLQVSAPSVPEVSSLKLSLVTVLHAILDIIQLETFLASHAIWVLEESTVISAISVQVSARPAAAAMVSIKLMVPVSNVALICGPMARISARHAVRVRMATSVINALRMALASNASQVGVARPPGVHAHSVRLLSSLQAQSHARTAMKALEVYIVFTAI